MFRPAMRTPGGPTWLGRSKTQRRMKMKLLRILMSIAVLSLASAAFAQSHEHDQQSNAQKSDAQKSFDQLKTLAGSWEGHAKVDPPQPDMHSDLPTQVILRVTSMGNLLLHEMKPSERPDNPITTIYLDGDKLQLTHYCDAGNRPRMVARPSNDGKTVEFDFADVAGSTKYGHMDHAVFTTIDENHHIEDWTFMINGKNGVVPIHAHFDLHRTKPAEVAAR
jgi:hypothetical protein